MVEFTIKQAGEVNKAPWTAQVKKGDEVTLALNSVLGGHQCFLHRLRGGKHEAVLLSSVVEKKNAKAVYDRVKSQLEELSK